MQKEEIIKYFKENIARISQWKNNKNVNHLLNKLNENGIYFDDFNFTTLNKEFSIYLFDLDTNFLKCDNPLCNNEKKYVKFLLDNARYKYGFKKYCSTDCLHKHRSIKQTGKNNTCHKITKEQREDMNYRQSQCVKNKIKNGTFTPNITNSWAGSKVKLFINNTKQYYRSSWEAFFHLCNNNLLYEKLRVKYNYKNNWHNYILDFVDEKIKLFMK